jgi:hypothetical protein
MSPHIRFALDEATYLAARERLRAAGMEFVEEGRQEYRVSERRPPFHEVRGRLRTPRGEFPARFHEWDGRYGFVLTVTHDVEVLEEVGRVLGHRGEG